MSAARGVVPRLWALASVAGAAAAVEARKGPHRLQLVEAAAGPAMVPAGQPAPAPVAEVAFYRKYTEGMLRRYMKLAMESGRVPSLLGQEMFRGRVTSCRVRSFEDVVIFVHDMERCIAELDKGQQQLLRRVTLQGHTQDEVAGMLGVSLRTVVRRYGEAVDRLTSILLRKGLLEPALEGGEL